MKRKNFPAIVIIISALALVVSMVFAAQDKYTLQVPDGGYALFNYDAASDTFKPEGSGNNCGYACHTRVKAKDYIFHPYQKR